MENPMDKYDIQEEIKEALVDGSKYICFRLEKIYSRQGNFTLIAKLLIELSLSKRENEENLEIRDLFDSTEEVISRIDELELFLNSKHH
jgi:hypothetical protein